MKTNRTTLIIAETAILTSVAIVLDYIANITQIRFFQNGGSVSIAMLPVFVLAFRRGLIPALTSGVLLGILQTLIGTTYMVNFISYLLDYPVAYGLVGLAGVTYKFVQKGNKTLVYGGITIGILFAGVMRYMAHVLSGVVYWASYTPEGWNIWGYSFFYNMTYMLPSIIICLALVIMINMVQRTIFVPENKF